KPERTHHCSTCKTCVLKMDHHCPWFACCIGFKNHKSFIQFLLLTTFYSLVILIANVLEVKAEIQKNFSSDLEGDDTNFLQFKICYLVFIATIFFLTLVVFDGYSIYLLINNMTTIEKMEFEDAQEREKVLLLEEGDGNDYNKMNIYDLGSKMINWRQVMGKHWFQWFL
ncbi:zf-DHHC-domain-containing protein, partial [Hanseniaspora valbyensis NRRL Y-1626]